jgi:hypothetical protein
VTVPFERPRHQRIRRSPEFIALVDEIADVLYGGGAEAVPEAAASEGDVN